MCSMKLPRIQGVSFTQLESTDSSYMDADTRRRKIYGRGISSSRSRKNKTCNQCGNPKGGRGLVCSACYRQLRSCRVGLTCLFCGKSFMRQAYNVRKSINRGTTDVYCSRQCGQSHQAVKNRRRRCETCGKPTPKKTSRFCSKSCRPKRSMPERLCDWCKVAYQPRSHRSRYCTKKCASKAHSVRMQGSGNSHFKNGLSYGKLFREMRPIIKARDGHCCVACGVPEKFRTWLSGGRNHRKSNLTIHHINDKPACNQPENLITICATCHAIHHKSALTPFPWFAAYARTASQSMTSKLKDAATSLLKAYSSITA